MGDPEAGADDTGRVFVVDDDALHLRGTVRQLSSEGFEVRGFSSAGEALHALEEAERPLHVLVTDVYMPEVTGLELLDSVRERWPSVTPILMTGQADVATAVEALRRGAYDYLVKPIELGALVRTVRRAIERTRLLERNLFVQRQLAVAERVEGLVGSSRLMQEVFSVMGTVAPTDATVLLLGESGTGKELVARSIHRQSKRSARAFVGINCGALAETLLESELFGHTRGAFTGAVAARRGLFEESSGGTLFLDEIGELTPATQVRLLRVLQEGEVRPVGSNQAVRIDTRVIAATNRNLRAEVDAGRFRKDLYYRLDVVTIDLPPLRKRLEDLAPLVHHLIRKRATRLGKSVAAIDDAVVERLAAHSWPGNVRELENVIERAIIMTRGDTITLDSLPAHLRGPTVAPPPTDDWSGELEPLTEARDAFERGYVRAVLRKAEGNLTTAARIAGLDRSNFRRLVRRLGLESTSPGVEE